MKKLALSIVTAALLAAPAALAQPRPEPPPPRPAPPEPPPPPPEPRSAAPEGAGEKEFGDQGTIAIGGTTSLNFGYEQITPPSGSSSSGIDIGLMPDVQYFVINGLSLGGTINFDWLKPDKGDAITTFGIGPTVGYNVWLKPGLLSVWPQATFLFNTRNISGTTPTGATVSGQETVMNVGVFVPLLIHPVSHFHFGVGPYFDIDVSAKDSSGGNSQDIDKSMHVGLRGEVAGWL